MARQSQSQQTPPHALGFQAARDLGLAFLDAEAPNEAIPYLQRANELRPTGYICVRLGKAHRELAHLTEALSSYEEALMLEGKGAMNRHARIGVAAVLSDRGELTDLNNAEQMIQAVLAEYPDDAAAHWTAYGIFTKLAQSYGYPAFSEAAERHKQRATELDPRHEEERLDEQRMRAVRAQRAPRPSVAPAPPQPLIATIADSEPTRSGPKQKVPALSSLKRLLRCLRRLSRRPHR